MARLLSGQTAPLASHIRRPPTAAPTRAVITTHRPRLDGRSGCGVGWAERGRSPGVISVYARSTRCICCSGAGERSSSSLSTSHRVDDQQRKGGGRRRKESANVVEEVELVKGAVVYLSGVSTPNRANRESLVEQFKKEHGAGQAAVRALRWVLLLYDHGVPLQDITTVATRAQPLLFMPLQRLADTCAFMKDTELLESKLWRSPVVEQLLGCQLEDQLQPTVFHLLSLGMSRTEICILLCRYPRFARYCVITKQRALVERLQSAYGVPLPAVRKILLRHPKVVGSSFEKMDEVAGLLYAELGIERRAFGVCLSRFPGLVSLSVALKLQPTIRALLQLGLTAAQVRQMVCDVPVLFSLDFSPGGKQWMKWQFLLHIMNKGPKDVLSFPRYFTCSLDRRIAPRVMFMLQHGIHPGDVPLQKILSLTNQSFAERTAGRPHDDYLAFLDTWTELPIWQEWIVEVELKAAEVRRTS